VAAPIVGREAELSALDAFLSSDARPRALVLTGGPGIGKTTLWDAAVDAGRRRGLRVLAARASDADTRLSFAALIDLLDDVEDGELASLPPPRRQALEIALLRAQPTGAPPEPHAIALGLLDALRTLAQHGPLLVAVDDLQWLDRASEDALAFAVRRLADEPAAFLLARRPGPRSELERALDATSLERVEVRSPSLAAIRRMLSDRLGLTLPRHVLRRLYDATLGNPLFVLELGRKVRDDGVPTIGEDLPVPDDVEELLGTRVAGLPDAVRHVLLAVALSPSLRVGQLASLAEPEALDLAVDAGVLAVDGDQVRASHPLLAAAAVRQSQAGERRALHRDLAGVVPEGELRTRHLALAAAQPDAELAATVAAGAASAARRGAPQPAVELGEHALRLTPPDDPDRNARLLELAGYLMIAGEKRRLTDLLEPHVPSLPAGATRAQAFLLLTSGEIRGNDDIQRYLELALAESGDDARARASVLADMAENVAAVRVERIAEAETWALEALPDTPGADPELERRVLYALAWTRTLGGRAIDDVWERFRTASPEPFYIAHSPERIAGQRLVWRGEIGAARAMLSRQLVEADERGEPSSYALQRLHLCELELRAGEWDAAEARLDEWAESADRELLHWPMYERCRALLAVGRGRPDEARRWGTEADARASAVGVRWDQLEAQRALGVAELLAHDTAAAASRLRAVWEHTEREGVCDPGAFPVAPELVEALAEEGALEEAGAVATRVEEHAAQQDHPWARATARRCAAQATLALLYDEEAVTSLERAAGEYARLGLGFDAARSLLALGRAQRRHRKWGAARATLERAAAAFDEQGSPGWAEAARSELGRVGARRPSPAGELTPAERRVAELAAQGLTNKEIAQTLVVSVNTVEFHLSNTYAKLGVRSRTELASRLAPSV
jgi:DNA-binding CsgD family transcriptional regulator